MVCFKLSFLLEFELNFERPPKKTKEKKKKKKKATKKSKKSSAKSSKSSKKSKTKTKSKVSRKTANDKIEEIPKYELQVGNPFGYAHIEYDLMPDRPKIQIDIIFWGSVVKVFCTDDVKISTTIKTSTTTAWVFIQVAHFTSEFQNDDILNLYAHCINCFIKDNKNDCGTRAKAENTKVFYLREEDVDSDDIVNVFHENPNLADKVDENYSLKVFMDDIIQESYSKPQAKSKEIVSILKYDKVHKYKAHRILGNITDGKTIKVKEFAPICLPPLTEDVVDAPSLVIRTQSETGKNKKKKGINQDGKSVKSKKSAKSKKSKGKKSKKMKTPKALVKFTVPGEVFITNPKFSVFALENSNKTIRSGYLLISVENLFNRLQEIYLNPLIISIDAIKNMPVEMLSERGFNEIYVEYNVPHVARCKTLIKSLTKDVIFNEAHAHFTHNICENTLKKFLAAEAFFIRVVGIREIAEIVNGNLFGEELDDQNISQHLSYDKYVFRTKEKTKEVVLATFGFDLSRLVNSSHFYKENNNGNQPEMVIFGAAKHKHVEKLFSVNHVNTTMPEKMIEYDEILQNRIIEYGTTLKVEIKSQAPIVLKEQTTSALMVPNNYQQIFVIFFDRLAYNNIFEAIHRHNQKLAEHRKSKLLLMKYYGADDCEKVTNLSSNVLTGFIIDNRDSIMMYVEGTTVGQIPNIWYLLTSYSTEALKVHYNSQLIFEKRLYDRFIPFGGILQIQLVQPIQLLLGNSHFYVKGNVPLGCYVAILKLNFLHKASAIRLMCQQKLFPTAEELMSLDIELGLPTVVEVDDDSSQNYREESQSDFPIDKEEIDEDIIYSCDMY